MLKEFTPDQILSFAFMGAHINGIAHNINTPLSAIMGRIELLQIRIAKAGELPPDGAEDILKKCLDDLEIITQCCWKIDGVLSNSVQTSAGIMASRTALVQLDQLLNSVLSFLNADMGFKHKTEKKFEFPAQVPPVMADPVAFSLAFLEILQNARNAMLQVPEKKLRITMSAEDGAITISFCDSGCGIPETSLAAVLEKLGSPTLPSGEPGESGLQRIGRLLRPYAVTYALRSRPGETVFTLRVPVVQDAL